MLGSLAPKTVTLAGLVAAASVVAVLLVVQRPAITRRIALASLPWFVTGATLHALAGGLGYPDVLAPVLTAPWVYVLVATVGGLVWASFHFLAWTTSVTPTYVGAAGAGAFLPPLVVLVVRGGLQDPRVLALWVAVPLVAVLVAYVTILALGTVLPEPAYFGGLVGVVIVVGLVVDGVTTALVVELGRESVALAAAGLTDRLAESLPTTHPLVPPSALIWTRLALGVTVLIGLELVSRSRPRLADGALGLVAVGSVVLGANTLMLVLGRGWLA